MATAQLAAPASQKIERQLLAGMSPDLQALATRGKDFVGIGHSAAVASAWDLGSLVQQAEEAPEQYKVVGKERGRKSVIQILSDFWNIPAERLISLKLFVEVFHKRDTVISLVSQPMADGRFLEEGHFHALRKLDSHEQIHKMLTNLRTKQAMSARELDEHIKAHNLPVRNPSRGGGRKLRVPSSPIAGLQKLDAIAKKFVNGYEDIFLKIEAQLAPTTDGDPGVLLERLETTCADMEKLMEAAEQIQTACAAKLRDHKQTHKASSKKRKEPAHA